MTSIGTSVGAFVVPRKMLNGLRLALRDCRLLKAGINITPFAGHPIPDDAVEPYAALHVSPVCAEAMNSHGAVTLQGWVENDSQLFIPAEVRPYLQSSRAFWVPGLRVGSPACARPPQPQAAIPHKRKQPNIISGNAEDEIELASDNVGKHPDGEARTATAGSTPAPVAFTFTELFAGVGGFRVALEQLGGQSVFTSEIDVEARAVLARSFANNTVGKDGKISPLPCGDITEVEDDGVPYDHDLLTGGFPCQSFSSMGRQEGFDDARGMLFLEVVRLLKASQPKAFLLENVANLAFLDGGKSLARIVAELESTGYHVMTRLLNSRVVLPQQRLRVYLVGFRRNYVLPRHASLTPTAATAVGAASASPLDRFAWPELPLLETSVSDILEDEASGVDMDSAYMLTPQQFTKLQANPDWCADPARRLVALHGPARTLMSSYRKGWVIRSEFVWRQPSLGSGSAAAAAGSYRGGTNESADDSTKSASTVDCTSSAKANSSYSSDSSNNFSSSDGPLRPRFYTVSECCALQGFPRTFASTLEDKRATTKPVNRKKNKKGNATATAASLPLQQEEQKRGADGRSYHQIGNAVSPPVVCAIAASILDALGITPGEPRGLHPSPLLLNTADDAAPGKKQDVSYANHQNNNGSNVDSPDAARQRRLVVAPALELLLSAYPRPSAPRGITTISSRNPTASTSGSHDSDSKLDSKPSRVGTGPTPRTTASLQKLCQSFLDGDPKGPAGCTGRLSSLADSRTGVSDLATVRRLLVSKQAAARVSALASIGRAVHLERKLIGARENGNIENSSNGSLGTVVGKTSGMDGSEGSLSCKAVLDGGLLPLICACLPPAVETADTKAVQLHMNSNKAPNVTLAPVVDPTGPVLSETNEPTQLEVTPEWVYSATERCMTTEDSKEVPHLALVALAVISRQPNKPLKGRLDEESVLKLRAAAARGGRSGSPAADVLANAGL